MLDANTKKACKDDPSIRKIKIRNIEHAIEQAELMICLLYTSPSPRD